MNEEANDFLKLTFELFGFLEGRGFSSTKDSIEINQLYCKVPFVGENVAIVFSFDFREKCCDCYVGKVVSREIVTDRSQGGYWSSFYSFLVKERSFRGRLPVDEKYKDCDFKELYGFKVLFDSLGEAFLNDDVTAFEITKK